MLEFRMLGPLEVLADGKPVSLPRKQRALLALLVLHVGEVVSTDRLIEELWAGKPPATAKDALQNYVSQLRKVLGADVIATRDPGYLLQAQREQVDVGRFEALVADARETEDAATRAGVLRQALALWRGTPLADLTYEAFTGLEAARLEELRAAARDDLVDAELELGRGTELIAELEATVTERPFDERPRGQLMLALYRTGRQADALEAYQQARQTLVAELGLDPSPELRELEQAILRQDPALAAPLAVPLVLEERRKTVTILFCDLVESTELAEALDPEVLRGVLDDYFGVCRRAIERHGGTVEKFIGDAVMAVFGVPRAHEDDALRAVRAAVEMRTAVTSLSEALERDQGLRLDIRIGLNTGEVYVGDPSGSGLVTGNAVHLAKRLEQAAPSGSVMLGVGTLELVRDAVRVKAIKPRTKTALTAFRLLELVEGAPAIARYLEAELVGRDDELAALRQAFEETVREGSPSLLAVVGEPGIGKTRLANELVALVEEEATVLTGRCIPYGEGATYVPLREMVSEIDLEAVLAGEEDAELVARRIAELVGLAEGTGSVDEGFWAIRRLFSVLASRRPLVLRVSDLHWAGTRLLDLLDQIAERAQGPIFLLCSGRPELLDERESWRERTLMLEPLSIDDARALAAALESDVTSDDQDRLVELAEGNPLFIEQLLAFAGERGGDALDSLPPSMEALLSARIDLLEPGVRETTRRAALIGRDFSRAGLIAVSTSEGAPVLSDHLLDLVRRGFVHPARLGRQEEGYRFHHALVRDVAYAGLPKAERAELHETFGDWLTGQPDAADEVVGYHLEQAYGYRTELAQPDRRAKQLAVDAGSRLGAAGMRAYRRADVPTTIDLLGRATSLLPEDDAWRRELLCELGVAFDAAGDTGQAAEVIDAAIASAEVAMDARVGYRGQLERTMVRLRVEPEGQANSMLEIAERAIPLLEQLDDDRSLSRAWLLAGWVHGGFHGRESERQAAAEQALTHYRSSGFPEATCVGQISAALYYGPAPADQAISRCEELLGDVHADRAGRANVLRYLGGLTACRGQVEEGRRLIAEARLALEDLGQKGAAHYCDAVVGDVEAWVGDHGAAADARKSLCEYCKETDDLGGLAAVAADLTEALCDLGAFEEADQWVEVARRNASSSDVPTQFAWRAVHARLQARRGAFDEAEVLAREAVRLAESTDMLNKHAGVLLALADVHRLSGDQRAEDEAVTRAIALYTRKGNVAAIERTRALLASHSRA